MPIKKITYLQKDGFDNKYCYELDVYEGREYILDGVRLLESDIKEMDISKKALKIFDIVKSWRDKYINLKILDGIEYTCVIEFDDGTVKKTYGKNKFPENFFEFKS